MRGAAASLAVAAGLLAAACEPPVKGNRTNVLLITIETTRADHLGAYGYPRETSPSLDRFAARGALFERDTSVSPRTNPSLASILTSTYPQEHGTRNILMPLAAEARTLAEILREDGYRTIGVQTHPRLVRSSGFEQGFGLYRDEIGEHPLAPQSLGLAGDLIEQAARDDRPWFLWIHVMDPHWTYDPPAPWRTRFGPEDPRPAELYRDLAERRRTIGPVIFRNAMPPDEIQAFVNLYDAEIRYTDEALGRLFERLGALGLDRKTLTIVTADHGESLGEHAYFFEHGDLGSEPEIHVPLVVVYPGRIPPATRVPWTVRSIDVAPTVLDLAGLPAESGFRGFSLAPMIDGREAADRPCFGETDRSLHTENDRHEVEGIPGKGRWVKLGRYKLVHTPRKDRPAGRALYDVESDPAESRDVAAEHAEVAARLGRMLDAWLAEDRPVERDYPITPELRETLRSLGYVD